MPPTEDASEKPWDNLLFVLDLHSCKHSPRWHWITVENHYWAWSQRILSLLLAHHHHIYSWIWKGRRQGWDLKNWKHNLSLISFLSYVHLSLLKSMVSISLRVLCCAKLLSRVWLSVTPWTVVCQAPLSMGFSRQEYWCELPCPLPGDLPKSGI